MTSLQKEISEKGSLLNPTGALTTACWMRQPLLDCNLEAARFYRLRFLQRLRIKRWDYYAVFTPSHFFSFTISDVGYLGMVFAYVINFETGEFKEQTLTLPFGGGVELPRNSTEGLTRYAGRAAQMTFEARPESRLVKVNWPAFDGLQAELRFDLPLEHQSTTMVIPIKDRRFYYNRKINCMPVEGWINFAGVRHELQPGETSGGLDWGRGVWEYDSFWVWASSSGFLADGRRVGLNMGYGFGDTSAATENALILEGRIHKLGVVDFRYDSGDFMAPWSMLAPDGRLQLTFTPILERVAKTDLKLLRSEVHQIFGRYRGFVLTDEGERLEIDGLIGFAEEHQARW